MENDPQPKPSCSIPDTKPIPAKSTPAEICERFDKDVARFSNLETGQSATVDAQLCMSLTAEAAAVVTPQACDMLDIGCGAGNYSLKLLQHLPGCNVTLVDLSQPMLDKALERVTPCTSGSVSTIQSDIRALQLDTSAYDIIIAAAVLHHLRDDQEWEEVFASIYKALRPSGSFWIFDLVESTLPAVRAMMWHRYGNYLKNFKDEEYRDHVFDYIEQEDTPRSLMYQIQLMQTVGFSSVEVLHKNSCFAAFGGVKV